jgi:flagellar hook-length control protein FliK
VINMEAATLAASIVPVKRQQSTGNLGAKSDTKAVKGAFANLLLALQGYAPTEAQSSPGTTTTDPTDKKGKDAASNSLLQALIQLLPGQLQSSLNTTQAAEDSVDSGGSGTVSAKSVAGLSSIINQAIDTLKTSGNAGQVDKSLLADLAGLSQTLQGNQTGAGKTGAVTTAGNTVDDQATASSSLFKNADGQATDLLAAVKTALNQTDPGVLNDKGNAQGGNMAVAESAAIQPRAPDGTTTTVSLNSQTPDETGANGVSNAGSDLKSSGAPTVTQGTMDSTALARTGQATGANGVSNAGSDLKSSGASTVTQGTMDSTALAETGQATGALSQSNQDSGMTGHSKETQVKDTSFVKPVSALETQQPQESAPQSPSGSEGMNNLLAQSSLQQHDLSSLTGLGQTTDSKSPTLGASVINQIVASANLAVNNDNASMSIQLKPEWLGDLKLVVDVEQGVVNAHFITQNQVTASLIQARLPELKQALNDQGISWQHLSVSSGAGQGSNQGASSQSQQNLNQSQTQYDYGSGDSTDSDAPPTIPVDYQWAGTGAFNYVV